MQATDSLAVTGFQPIACRWLIKLAGPDLRVHRRFRVHPSTKELKNLLLKEIPGILNWAIEGCRAWHCEGRNFAESMLSATSDYRRESDQVGRFVEEMCSRGDGFRRRARDLYAAYREWAERAGEAHLFEAAFCLRMVTDGFKREHTARGNV